MPATLYIYSNVTADSTRLLSQQLIPLLPHLSEGWNGVIAADPDGTSYLLLSRFGGEGRATLTDIATPQGAPVFGTTTTVGRRGSRATFAVEENHSVGAAPALLCHGQRRDGQRAGRPAQAHGIAPPHGHRGLSGLHAAAGDSGANTAVTVTRHNDSLNVESER
jgi:hypothetical protein